MPFTDIDLLHIPDYEKRPHRIDRVNWRSSTRGSKGDIVVKGIAISERLEIEVPPAVRENYERSLELAAESKAVPLPQPAASPVQRLASGELTAAAAVKAASKAPDIDDELTRAREAKDLLHDAAGVAWGSAFMGFGSVDEATWLGRLRDIIGSTMAAPHSRIAEQQYEDARDLQVILASTGAIEYVSAPGNTRFAREASWFGAGIVELHLWRIANSKEIKVISKERAGNTMYYWARPVGHPRISFVDICQHQDRWTPGAYSARDVLDVLGTLKAEAAAIHKSIRQGTTPVMTGAAGRLR